MSPYHLIAIGPSEIRSEEHTSELQSLTNIVCRLLLEKKKTKQANPRYTSTSTSSRNARSTSPSPWAATAEEHGATHIASRRAHCCATDAAERRQQQHK